MTEGRGSLTCREGDRGDDRRGGGGCEELSEFTCSSGGELCVCVCVCVIVSVKLTAQRPSRLYCCLSPQQKLSGGDRLAASLISALFPLL